MSLHIFHFEKDTYPSEDEQLARVKAALIGLRFTNPVDIQNVVYALFVERKDVTIKINAQRVPEVLISQTKSRYDLGALAVEFTRTSST